MHIYKIVPVSRLHEQEIHNELYIPDVAADLIWGYSQREESRK